MVGMFSGGLTAAEFGSSYAPAVVVGGSGCDDGPAGNGMLFPATAGSGMLRPSNGFLLPFGSPPAAGDGPPPANRFSVCGPAGDRFFAPLCRAA